MQLQRKRAGVLYVYNGQLCFRGRYCSACIAGNGEPLQLELADISLTTPAKQFYSKTVSQFPTSSSRYLWAYFCVHGSWGSAGGQGPHARFTMTKSNAEACSCSKKTFFKGRLSGVVQAFRLAFFFSLTPRPSTPRLLLHDGK